MTDALADAGPAERWAAVLLTSELVSKVVARTDREIRLTIAPGPPIRVEVHDGDAATEVFEQVLAEAPIPVRESAVSGRGVELVHLLASRIGRDNAPDGSKVVWFELTPESVRGDRAGPPAPPR